MKTLKLVTVLGVSLWLSGCIWFPDGWWVDGPRYHHHHSDGDGGRGFCPPGHAKKGEC